MPVRPRRRRARSVFGEWSQMEIEIALNIGPHPVEQGGPPDDVLRRAWTLLGPKLAERGGRGWGFWMMSPGVPDDLRGERPRFIPLEDLERVEAEEADLDHRRAAWLAEQHRRT